MKKLDKIHLYNRYDDNIYLQHYKNDDWLLKGDDGCLQYVRVGFNEDKSICFVDPSGGPFLSIGTKVNDKVITKIEHIESVGFVLTLKDEDK